MTSTLAVLAVGLFVPAADARTVVTLGFDDGFESQLQATSILNAHGVRGTFYIISGKPGSGPGYMTWEQVDSLAAAGHEIGGQTITHPDLEKMTPAEQRHEICDGRTALQAHGYAVDNFAYPFGHFNDSAKQAVRDCGYETGRRVGGVVSIGWCPTCSSPFAESFPPADPMVTLTPATDGELTLVNMQAFVTAAEEHGGGWVQIVLHQVCDNFCDDGSVSAGNLDAFLTWLAARRSGGTVIETARDAIEQSPRPRVRLQKRSRGDAARLLRLAIDGLSDRSTGVLDLRTRGAGGRVALHRTLHGTGERLVVRWRVPKWLARLTARRGRLRLTGTLDLGSRALDYRVGLMVRAKALGLRR